MSSIYFAFIKEVNTGEQQLFCFTEEEKNQIVNEDKIDESNFHKATTFEEINSCIQMKQQVMRQRTRQNSYSHPTCSMSRVNILNKLVEYTQGHNIFLTPLATDIKFGTIFDTKKYGEIYTTYIPNEFLKVWEELDKQTNFTVILKASDNFGGIGHTFTIFIDIVTNGDNEPYIEEICVVDTAQTPVVPEIFAKTISLRLGIPLEGEIQFMFEESEFVHYGMGLQDEEKKMDIRGYCGAWSLYFIYNFIRFQKLDRGVTSQTILEKLYKYLGMRKNELTALIIHWWDTIISRPESDIEDWQTIPELKQVLPSDDIIPDIEDVSNIEDDEGDELSDIDEKMSEF